MDKVLNEIFFEIKNKCDSDTYNYLKSFITTKLYNYKLVEEVQDIVPYEPSKNEQLFKMFLISKKLQGLSDGTLKAYSSSIKSFMYSINKPLIEVKANDIRYYLANMQLGGTVSNVSLDNTRRNLSAFFQWMEDEEHIAKNPVKKIGKIKFKRTVKEAFTDDEVALLKVKSRKGLEITAIEILLSTGVRCNELINIKISDINFEESEIKILGKGNKERIVYLNSSAKARILEYLRIKKGNSKYLFTKKLSPYTKITADYMREIIRKLGKRCKITNVHPHRFRRTFATIAHKRGMAIEEIQTILGHSSISTTQIYVCVDREDVKRNHKKLI